MTESTKKKFKWLLIGLAIYALYVAVEVVRHRPDWLPALPSLSPPPAPSGPWWQGVWKNADGPAHPYLELAPQRGSVTGQFVESFSDGYLISRAVGGASDQASGNQLLLTIDPKPDPVPAEEKSDRPPSPLYLLVRREEGRAELYRLKEAPGLPRVVRGSFTSAAKPIVYPDLDQLDRHQKIASFVKAEGRP